MSGVGVAGSFHQERLSLLQEFGLDESPRVSIPARRFRPPRSPKAPLSQQIKNRYLTDLKRDMATIKKLSAAVPDGLRLRCEVLEEETHKLCEALSKKRGAEKQPLGLSSRVKKLHCRLCDFEVRASENLWQRLGISPGKEAKKIWHGLLFGWEDFVRCEPRTSLLEQIHGIKGLKVYALPGTKTLVADYAAKIIGKGRSKVAKSMIRIGDPIGSVRLVSQVKKISAPPADAAMEAKRAYQEKIHEEIVFFAQDITKELGARQVLLQKGVPHVAAMTAVSYFGKKGPKIRYIMPRFASDLWEVTQKEKNSEKALRCCVDVAESLEAMHRGALVHGDVKTQNVLTDGERGYLSDFAFMGEEGGLSYFGFTGKSKEGCTPGTAVYMAPETIFGDDGKGGTCCYSSKSDMFSFGLLLLESVNPNLANLWYNNVSLLDNYFRVVVMNLSGREKAEKLAEYRHVYDGLLGTFLGGLRRYSEAYPEEKRGPYSLIFRLLDENPENRPSAEDVLRQLRP